MSKTVRRISGRTAVISGAASGIGRALAQRLSAQWLPGGDHRHRRARFEGDRGRSLRADAFPGARRARRRRATRLRRRGARLGARPAGRGVQQRRRRRRLQRARFRSRRRQLVVGHQLPRGRQRNAGVPADPGRAGLRRDREHLECVRPRRHAQPKCLLLSEIRRPRLHRLAASRAARHRRDRHQRASGRYQHQHRAQRPLPQGPGRPGSHPRADGAGVRRASP